MCDYSAEGPKWSEHVRVTVNEGGREEKVTKFLYLTEDISILNAKLQ